ncbi:MAG: TonB-dependent receptor [Vicinamibacterales bacterium]|nr:TonB-dependent receptor [Vicinamibacterales bacterium]
MCKWLVGVAAVVAMLVSGTGVAFAQNAQIVGTLVDSSGGVLPGVTVMARNDDTGLTRTTVSEGNGDFRLSALPPGTYTVTAELPGFRTGTRTGLILVIDQTSRVDLTLTPAELAETVMVTGEAPLIDARQSTVSTAVTSAQIQDLPVASRRWVDLAMLTPGVSQDNIRGFFYRGNINIGAGTREYSNGFVVDGVNNTWAQMGEPRQNFAMDSIREFRVSQSTYKAELGLATGGVLSVVTRSGTNQLSGSAFNFFRDKALTAKTYFEAERPDFRRWQYGGTFGGPIVMDKTHFFIAAERSDENQFFTVNTGGRFPQYDGTYVSEQYRWTYTARVDHQISQTQNVFFRGSQEVEQRPIITAGGRVHPTNSFDFGVPRSSWVAGHTWILGGSVVNDLRVQYAYAKYQVSPPYSGGSWEPGDFGQDRVGQCTAIFNYPSLGLGGCGNSQMGPEKRYQIKNDTSITRGDHQFKFGADFSFIDFRGDNLGSPLGSWTFPTDAEYNAAIPSTYPTQWVNSLPTYAEIPVRHFSVYLQDDWQIARNVTLNAGLRYDAQFGSFNEDLPDLLGRIGDKLGPQFAQFPLEIPFHQGSGDRGDRNNFGPRVGMAWDVMSDGRTKVHAGYGMFYDNHRTLQLFGELTWPQAQQIIIRNPSFPDPLQGRSRDEFLSTAPPNINVLANDAVNPYAHQASGGVSRMIGQNLGLNVDVIVVRRKSDRDTVDLNLPDQVTRQRPYPQFGRVNYWQYTADNSYNALLVKFEKRMSNNYQYLLSYTLSESEDDAFRNVYSDFYGFRKSRFPGSADRRHRLVASGIVQMPYGIMASVIADFRSSLPMNPVSGLDLNGDGYTGDLPAGVTPFSGCRDLNLDAINAFRQSRGQAPVSEVECPGFMNFDMRLSKTFQIGQTHAVEIIGQLLNITNRANFNVPSNNITAGTFGQSTSLLPNINAPSRQAEIAIRYRF